MTSATRLSASAVVQRTGVAAATVAAKTRTENKLSRTANTPPLPKQGSARYSAPRVLPHPILAKRKQELTGIARRGRSSTSKPPTCQAWRSRRLKRVMAITDCRFWARVDRAHRERPRRRAAEQRDEGASP